MDVILDVDTGVDDGLALLFAIRHPALRVLAVTCVTGNVGVDQVLINTLKVLDAAGAPADLPVAAGATRPLIAAADLTRSAHGLDGLADLGLRSSSRRPVSMHAVELLHQLLQPAIAPITLVCLAPLTNLALLLRLYPSVAASIGRVICVGGSLYRTDSADFNLRSDPEAATIVLGFGLPVTMYGSDVFYDVTIDRTDAARLVTSPDGAAGLAGLLAAHQIARFGTGYAPIGDAGAVISLVAPEGLGTTRDSGHVEIASSVDFGRYRDLFLDTLMPAEPGQVAPTGQFGAPTG
ncbi:MAG TPA: nucleoside hydrolase [Actinomycetes bacterium]|nr:nucleoside hydrolase [Actinomycetes bacterium]